MVEFNSEGKKTCSVAELITVLQKYSPALPVTASWEGQVVAVKLDTSELRLQEKWLLPNFCLDVDNY